VYATYVPDTKTCGSGLAREEARTVTARTQP
jgi:hypothetical protein